jgi:hypothetical protein
MWFHSVKSKYVVKLHIRQFNGITQQHGAGSFFQAMKDTDERYMNVTCQ